MKLPPHLSSKIDYLIPDDIIRGFELDRFDFELVIKGNPSFGKYPEFRIWVDNTLEWSGIVVGDQTIKISRKLDIYKAQLQIRLEFYGKDDMTGTKLDLDGNIIENQSVRLNEIKINDIDLISNSSIYEFGYYYRNFNDDKKRYFQQHGYDTNPTHSLDMTENGEWKLEFDTPLVRSIARKVAPQNASLKWPDNDLLISIIEKCDRIDRLEKIKQCLTKENNDGIDI